MTQDQRGASAQYRKAEDAKGFDLNALDVCGTYLLDLKARGELYAVYLNGKRRGWHVVMIGSLAEAKKQYDFHVQDRPGRCAKLVSQKGVIEDHKDYEEEAL